MKVSEIKATILEMQTKEIEDEYYLYASLQSKGVNDEIILTLLENELIFNRGVVLQ